MIGEVYCCICGKYINTIRLEGDSNDDTILEESICELCAEGEE